MWNVWVCDTVTGVKQQCLPVSAFSWARTLNAGGSGSATVQLRDDDVKKLNVKTLTVLVKNTLVLEWRALFTPESTAVVVYAGIMWARKYNQTAGTLTIQHADIWAMLARRLAVNHYESVVSTWEVTYTNLTLRQYVKYLVTLGIFGPGNANMMLPITLTADESGSITRTIHGYQLPGLLESLEDVINEEGGPDVDLKPRWLDGKLDWLMRVGSTASPQLSQGSWEWNLGLSESGLVGLTVDEDSAKQVTNMIAVGEGSEEDMLIRSNRIVDPPIPHMERLDPHKDEKDAIRLAALANGGLNAFKATTETWDFSILASGAPNVTDLLLGGTAKVWSQADDWLDDGFSSNRLIGYSGDLSDNVKLQFQPGSF